MVGRGPSEPNLARSRGQRREPDDHELLRINDALDELEAKDPDLAELVQLRYFCSLSLAQIGVLRGVARFASTSNRASSAAACRSGATSFAT